MSKLSPNLERILADAAGDPRFKAQLLQDRTRAIEEHGHQLTDTEREILAAVSDQELERMCSILADELAEEQARRESESERALLEQAIRPDHEHHLVGGSRPSRPLSRLLRLFWWRK